MDAREVSRWLRLQDGVVSRGQVLAAGGTDGDIERLVRRREWARVHPGVYVDHTGPLEAFEPAGRLSPLTVPAALSGSSAVRAPV